MAVDLTIETTKYELVLVAETSELVLQSTVVEITLTLVHGHGDMQKATYDPANGSRQVAFADEIPTNTSELENDSGFITIDDIPPFNDLWEADGDSTIRPKPLEGGDPVTVWMDYITPPIAELETEPVDTDYFAIFTTSWKRFSWLNLKTWLKQLFKTYCGFENRTDSELSAVDDGGWQFTIAPKAPATSYHVWSGGVKRTISNSLTISVSADLVLYYIYFDTDGSLVASTSIWDFESENAPVAIFYRDGTSFALTDERHSYARNRVQHGLDHNTIGARYKSGFTGSFLNASFSVTQGIIYDEDIRFDSETTKTACSIWHRATTLDRMRLIRGSATVYPTVGAALAYDLNGTLTPLGANQYGVYWVYATNDPLEPIYAVASQAAYNNLTTARNAASPTIYLSTAEWKLLYRVIYRNTSPITYIEAADFRTVQTGTPITATTQDHAALINRDAANSHPASASTIDDPFTPSNAVVLAGDTALVGFQKLQGQVNNIKDDYILKYTVPTDVALVTLSVDRYGNAFNFIEGQKIEIFVYATFENTATGTGNIAIRVNGITDTIYRTSNFTATGVISAFYTDVDFRKNQRLRAEYILVGTELQGAASTHAITTADAPVQTTYVNRTLGLNASAITSISFMARPTMDRNIGAGTIIIIKKA